MQPAAVAGSNRRVLGLTDEQLAELIDRGQFSEVFENDQKVSE